MYVKPTAGRQVPDPQHGDFLPEDGREVEANQYWYRRQVDGDIEVAEPPKEDGDVELVEPPKKAAVTVATTPGSTQSTILP